MGKLLVLSVVTGFVGFGALYWFVLLGDTQAPTLPDFYWGPKAKEGQKEDTSIRPFTIKIEDKVLTDLKTRLKYETEGNRELPPLEGIGFQYGFNSKYLEQVTAHWLNKYDWRARETLLNKYPHFKTTIEGIEIHFQHIKGTGKKPVKPLLLVHGWPGSFVEFQKAIPLLQNPKDSDIEFELIIPSLPGYGFSERAYRPGLGPMEMAQVLLKLMKRIGHEQFYVQGGDWGSLIGSNLGALYPKNVKALHLNMAMSDHPKDMFRLFLASLYPSFFINPEEKIDLLYPLSTYFSRLIEETGYLHLQATKPDTIGASLSNSPTGLAAYILEKFSTWTKLAWKEKEDGGLPFYNTDELLDHVMVYWVTNSITSSMRLYSEAMSRRQGAYNMAAVPINVPTGVLSSPEEFMGGRSSFHLQAKYPQLLSFTEAKDGGHFTAFEQPKVFATELIKFFNLANRKATLNTSTKKEL